MKWTVVFGVLVLGLPAMAGWDDEPDPLDSRPTARAQSTPYENLPDPCLGTERWVSDAEVVRGRVKGTYQDDGNRVAPSKHLFEAVQHAEVSRVRERCRGDKRARAPRQ